LRHTKEQLEYARIDAEYEFVKKRAVVNFVINSKKNADESFHKRSLAMLNQVRLFEENNLKGAMREIINASSKNVLAQVAEPEMGEKIKRASFEAALDGMRTGLMTYQ